jgi:hypothetical protein
VGEPGGAAARPAFYAAGPGPWRDWWTLLHPPYTAWHLSYVVIGACLAPQVDVGLLLLTLAAFFLAVGISAHALVELGATARIPSDADRGHRGKPGCALACGAADRAGGPGLLPYLIIGPVLVIAYNAKPGAGSSTTTWASPCRGGVPAADRLRRADRRVARVGPAAGRGRGRRAVRRAARPEHPGPHDPAAVRARRGQDDSGLRSSVLHAPPSRGPGDSETHR